MPILISKTQAAFLQLMADNSFNDFDGPLVVKSLKDNMELWKGTLFTRTKYSELIVLRDIDDSYNADELYITSVKGQEDALFALAKTWDADDVAWLSEDEACKRLGSFPQPPKAVLWVWWD